MGNDFQAVVPHLLNSTLVFGQGIIEGDLF
jgi:hypothetical protein